jgi:hypothetical protein
LLWDDILMIAFPSIVIVDLGFSFVDMNEEHNGVR